MNYRPAIVTWLLLLVLLGASLTLVVLMPGTIQRVISFACAAAIGALIMIFYMRLRAADGILRTFAVGGLVWLAFLVILTFLEVVTRV
jgi:cytochrome c oxidase subunit 4